MDKNQEAVFLGAAGVGVGIAGAAVGVAWVVSEPIYSFLRAIISATAGIHVMATDLTGDRNSMARSSSKRAPDRPLRAMFFAIVRMEQGRYDEMRETAMTTERIEINPAIMMGRPIIRGTRITVELILRKLAEGESEGELLEDYPNLTTEDIRAAVAYGAASVAHEEVVLLPDAPTLGKS